MPSISQHKIDEYEATIAALRIDVKVLAERNYKVSVKCEGYGQILTAVRTVANGRPLPRSGAHNQNYVSGSSTTESSSVEGGTIRPYAAPLSPPIEQRVFDENTSLHQEITYLTARLASVFTLLDYFDSLQ